MSQNSKIEWCDATWNPIVGCSKVSAGCANCYAIGQAHRLASNPQTPAYHGLTQITNGRQNWTGKVALVEKALDWPLRRRKPLRIFVNSMGDLFHPTVPEAWIDRVFGVMCAAGAQRGVCAGPDAHQFLILTKQAKRMREYMADPERAQKVYDASREKWGNVWPRPNIQLGVSAEDQAAADERIPELLQTPAAVRFVSLEPLLGAVDLYRAPWRSLQSKLDWVIAGGESGPKARPTHPDWLRSVRDQCAAAGVPFFFKQWGEWHPADTAKAPYPPEPPYYKGFEFPDKTKVVRITKKRAGRVLDGRTHAEFPQAVRP